MKGLLSRKSWRTQSEMVENQLQLKKDPQREAEVIREEAGGCSQYCQCEWRMFSESPSVMTWPQGQHSWLVEESLKSWV